jgi:hypothetical protein
MCYEIRRAYACADYSAQHALVNAGKGDCVIEGEEEEGERERERALGVRLRHNPQYRSWSSTPSLGPPPVTSLFNLFFGLLCFCRTYLNFVLLSIYKNVT